MKILMFVLVAVLLAACQDNGPTSSTETRVLSAQEERNIVRISNLTPTEAIAGEAVTVTFDVDYNLMGVSQGVINIGFNNNNVNSYTFVSERKVVNEGYGTVSFQLTTTAVKWDEPNAFKLSVSLSEYPHPSSWSPLATDAKTIEVSEASVLNPRSAVIGKGVADGAEVVAGFGQIEECFNDTSLEVTYCSQF